MSSKNIILLGLLFFAACKQIVSVPGPGDQLTDEKVFSTDATANAAVAGIYQTLRDQVFYSPTATILTGLSSDELYNFCPSLVLDPFYHNHIDPSNSYNLSLWQGLYKCIYQANAVIEGVSGSNTLSATTRSQLLGESKFLRAFSYFYLVNLYSDVPLITTTDLDVNLTTARAPVDKVYDQILQDLQEAQSQTAVINPYGYGEKIRVNQFAITALLARVYLYTGDWEDAEQQASALIGSGNFSLVTDLRTAFKKNNPEAIFQLANNASDYIYETSYFIFTTQPNVLCTSSLLNTFEDNDQRKDNWIQSAAFSGITYSYPVKYKGTSAGSGEYYTLLRLGEQYLIRAESRARQNRMEDALDDLNQIRIRAGLSPVIGPVSRDSCLIDIMHERQVELFAEGGHRWFDLKRTGMADPVLSLEKPGTWTPAAALYPIPQSEIQKNSRLTQNSGY